MNDESGPPVKIDIAAKANIELKAEVPKESMGRLVDALTDVIRPLTETLGLRADQIRLQRADIALEIAKKAIEQANLRLIELRPISSKVIVPLLEKASLEDSDVELREAWATLLVSATKADHARHLTFVDILSRISSQELKLLERVCFAHPLFPNKSYPHGHAESNHEAVEAQLNLLVLPAGQRSQSNKARDKFVRAASLTYGEFMFVSVQSPEGTSYFYFEDGLPAQPTRGFDSLEILQRERLIEMIKVSHFGMTGVNVGYFNVTRLGIEFVMDCSPLSEEMAKRRPPPVQPQTMSGEMAEQLMSELRKKEIDK